MGGSVLGGGGGVWGAQVGSTRASTTTSVPQELDEFDLEPIHCLTPCPPFHLRSVPQELDELYLKPLFGGRGAGEEGRLGSPRHQHLPLAEGNHVEQDRWAAPGSPPGSQGSRAGGPGYAYQACCECCAAPCTQQYVRAAQQERHARPGDASALRGSSAAERRGRETGRVAAAGHDRLRPLWPARCCGPLPSPDPVMDCSVTLCSAKP